MRGKDTGIRLFYHAIRITPAYAGKRPAKHSVKRYERDHPRLCGEKRTFSKRASFCLGSPPPMRGKDLFHYL